jgi:hypothetical protein
MKQPTIEPFHDRAITTLPSLEHQGWTIKRYAICYGATSHDASRFDGGRSLALSVLSPSATGPGRVGAGFIIEHQGNMVDYLVLAWWDRQNELPLRVFVREPGADWRAARDAESVCVWDLQIIWAERQAYVSTVMAGKDSRDYLRLDAAQGA